MKKILSVLILTCILSCKAENNEDQFEENYLRSRFEQTCYLEGLAGKQSLNICFMVHQLAHAIADPECLANALLLYGPPGTGKTSIANSMSHMASAEKIYYSATAMVTKWQGCGEKSIRDMFEKVDKALNNGKKVLLFVDEIDAFSTSRNEHANEDRVNALLAFMQEIVNRKDDARLVIVAATNKKETLDDAFLSRFKLVEVELPNRDMCEKILSHHLKKYHCHSKINIQEFASQINHLHMSGRDIEGIVKSARQKSKMSGAPIILVAALEDAIEEMAEQKKKILEEKEKREYKEKRKEDMAEMNYQAMKEDKDRRLKNRILGNKKESDDGDDDDDSALSHIARGTKKLFGG